MKKLRATAATARYRTLRFTEEEKTRIDKAARICGGIDGRSAIWARYMLLTDVSTILKYDRESRKPGARLRARLRYLNGDAA